MSWREAEPLMCARAWQIKVGQFKDGLDMSAIREVKFLRELRHPNVIEVRLSISIAEVICRQGS